MRNTLKKVRYKGKVYEVKDDATVADMKRELGVPVDYLLVDDQGRKLRDDEKVGKAVRDGAGVAPARRARYG